MSAAIEQRAVREAVGSARYATLALLIVAGAQVLQLGTMLWIRSILVRYAAGETTPQQRWGAIGRLSSALQMVTLALSVATAIAFLRWLVRTTAVARLIGERPFTWSPSRAILSFFVPIANLIRPYLLLRDLHDSLAFERLPKPAARVSEASVGYRDAAIVELPPAPALPRAFIALWWATYIAGIMAAVLMGANQGEDVETIIGACNLSTIQSAIEVVAALLGARVVVAVTARLRERHRRQSFVRQP